MAVTKTLLFTGAGTWVVPTDCNVAVPATVLGIAGGGGGGRGRVKYCSGGGGGGGAYSFSTVTLPAIGSDTWYDAGTGGLGGSVDGADGADGLDTWYSIASNVAPASASDGVVAKGGVGGGGVSITGGAGGASGSGVGDTKASGGDGGDGKTGHNGKAGGGGGGSAASNLGIGKNGGDGYGTPFNAGSGGGGGGTGGAGPNGVNSGAVAGGLSYTGGAGGAAGGGPGSEGSGGGATQENSFSNGGVGGDGIEYSLTDGSTAGSGGGGGGSGGGDNHGTGGEGGAGGLYGGGGAGSSGNNYSGGSVTRNGGNGANGVVILTYTVGAAPAASANRTNNLLVQAVIANHEEDLDRPAQRNLRAWTINQDGHSFYVLYLGNEGVLVYDQTTKTWSEWQSFTPSNSIAQWRGRCGWNWGPDKIVGDDNIGLLWDMSVETYQDEPPYEADYNYDITAILTGGLSVLGRNTVNCAGVILSCSVSEPNTSGTSISLETSDDQGRTFNNQGSVTLNTDTQQEIQWLSLGRMVSPLRVFRLTDNGIPRIDETETWSK